MRRGACLAAVAVILALAAAACGGGDGSVAAEDAKAAAGAPREVVSLKMVTVGDPGNPSVGVVTTFVAGTEEGFVQIPKNGGIYSDCGEAPPSPPECFEVGGVGYEYEIGELEVTVAQYVAFLNTADPLGKNKRGLYHDYMNPEVWPKFGSVAYAPEAEPGEHYSVAYPEWAEKPFGFANFPRAARFDNSVYNGEVLSQKTSTEAGFDVTTYRVRLSPQTETGMYDMHEPATTRKSKSGFVIPSDNEWLKAAYFDPEGGGRFSYWQYPTGPSLREPNVSKLDPTTGDVVNAEQQPLATYSPEGPQAPAGTYPVWCPPQAGAKACETENPYGLPPGISAEGFQGSLSTVGQAKTRSPWGTLDQGGNVVEWQDTIVPAFQGHHFERVWRRMHGGVANAAAYQMLISALGFQPQSQPLLDSVYPWFGFRLGAIGEIGKQG